MSIENAGKGRVLMQSGYYTGSHTYRSGGQIIESEEAFEEAEDE